MQERGGDVVAMRLVQKAAAVSLDPRLAGEKFPQQRGAARPVNSRQPRDQYRRFA